MSNLEKAIRSIIAVQKNSRQNSILMSSINYVKMVAILSILVLGTKINL